MIPHLGSFIEDTSIKRAHFYTNLHLFFNCVSCFSDFCSLHSKLAKDYTHISLPNLPKKTLPWNKLKDSVRQDRVEQLVEKKKKSILFSHYVCFISKGNYLGKLTMRVSPQTCPKLKKFLEKDKTMIQGVIALAHDGQVVASIRDGITHQ